MTVQICSNMGLKIYMTCQINLLLIKLFRPI